VKKKEFVEVLEAAAQGDVLLFRVSAVPTDAHRVDPEHGQLIVTHSETGHHHAIAAQPGLTLFQHSTDPLVGWIRIEKSAQHADVVHHRPWHTHQTLRLLYADSPLGETIFEIRRQRENSPEGWRRVQD